MKKVTLHIVLFCLTFFTITLAGVEWIYGSQPFSIIFSPFYWKGLPFSLPFLLIITVHEFGHFFTAKFYKCQVTLPYYIPSWSFPGIGTFGAVIRIKNHIINKNIYFDIGVAGPIAGFFITLMVLVYGFYNLPSMEYIFTIHPDYAQYGLEFEKYVYNSNDFISIIFGENLLFTFLKNTIPQDMSSVPNSYEMMHYPFLFAGYLGCFLTALNLLPMGQLDGGHVLYGVVGAKKHALISRIVLCFLILWGGIDLIEPIIDNQYNFLTIPIYIIVLNFCMRKVFKSYIHVFSLSMGLFILQIAIERFFPNIEGFTGWLVFSLLVGGIMGIDHPKTTINPKAGKIRLWVAFFTLLIFIICFSPIPFKTN